MVQRITLAPQGPEFSRFVMGYWRLMDWNMSARQLVSFIEEHLDLGVTTVDHADIYGGYQCEAAFGEALKLAPHLRQRMEIVSKCGIATTARAENALGHYITSRDHIIASAEQSLVNLATERLDLLLIHRPDPLMDADEVAEAFLHLHQSGKVSHFGVSNFTPAQFSLLQSRLPFTWRPTRLRFLRFTSRYYWTVRSISCSNCAFDRWPGPALAVDVCSTMRHSSHCVMNWRKSRKS
jgi:predicted oxidoreductase